MAHDAHTPMADQYVPVHARRMHELSAAAGHPKTLAALEGDSAHDALVELAARELALARRENTQAARDVLAERRRQIEAEGWTPEHDDAHSTAELAMAAACYCEGGSPDMCPGRWPWAADAWKPTDLRRNLVKAGALIQAALERFDRNLAALEHELERLEAEEREAAGDANA